MQYELYRFDNGLRITHQQISSPVAYAGFAVNVGARDENISDFGIAHFIEHMLFKGTIKRKPHHIINRMEKVGGELNAYTTKEETFIYSVFLEEDYERAIELLVDLTFNSIFPEKEIRKEIEVVLDEINSYNDNPAELIFDDFENLLFKDHQIGHNILGEESTLKTFDNKKCFNFFRKFYHPENIIFFSMGNITLKKIVRIFEKYIKNISHDQFTIFPRIVPNINNLQKIKLEKGLFQSHILMGTRAYPMKDPNRLGLFLLNNVLGGPGMNSRLNINLREKNGLVYNIESNLTSYTDCGVFSIYLGCDHKYVNKCLELIDKELKKLCAKRLTDNQLFAAKKQLKGQLSIARDNKENLCLSMAKNHLHNNDFNDLPILYKKIDNLNAYQLLEIANEIFNSDNFCRLIYE